MKNTLNNVLIFTVGAAIGSAVTWYFVKKKYEREISDLVADFAQHRYTGLNDADEAKAIEQHDIPEEEKENTDTTTMFVNGEVFTTAEKAEFTGMVHNLGYHNYSDVEPTLVKPKKNDIPIKESSSARVITPEEFGEEDYKIVELTYWADGVLTDNKNKRIQDVDGLIGKDSLERFGEYEPDALHVRNDEKKLDFEIMRDLKRYSDFFDDDDPHQAEEE